MLQWYFKTLKIFYLVIFSNMLYLEALLQGFSLRTIFKHTYISYANWINLRLRGNLVLISVTEIHLFQ